MCIFMFIFNLQAKFQIKGQKHNANPIYQNYFYQDFSTRFSNDYVTDPDSVLTND